MRHRKILLVDDDPDDQFVFMDALSELEGQLECVTANNGIEAIAHLDKAAEKPSIIFLDLNMPLMNGFEFLQHVKKQERLNDIPVIIFTTSNNPADKKLSKEFGAHEFLTKTADFKSLKSTLAEILKITQ